MFIPLHYNLKKLFLRIYVKFCTLYNKILSCITISTKMEAKCRTCFLATFLHILIMLRCRLRIFNSCLFFHCEFTINFKYKPLKRFSYENVDDKVNVFYSSSISVVRHKLLYEKNNFNKHNYIKSKNYCFNI